jgi:Zn-dependent alcohol dehydrogenase
MSPLGSDLTAGNGPEGLAEDSDRWQLGIFTSGDQHEIPRDGRHERQLAQASGQSARGRVLGNDVDPSVHSLQQRHGCRPDRRDIVTERGDEGVARIMDLTNGVGADSVLECVGTQESMMRAIHAARPGGYVGYVGVPHGVELNGEELFFEHVHLHGGPAPVRKYLPKLIDLVWSGKINPGKVFDLSLPLDQVADAYRAMDERRPIKALLRP